MLSNGRCGLAAARLASGRSSGVRIVPVARGTSAGVIRLVTVKMPSRTTNIAARTWGFVFGVLKIADGVIWRAPGTA